MKLLHNFIKKTSFLVKKMEKMEKRLFKKLTKADILRIAKKIITNNPMQ